MAPAKLSHDVISIVEEVANFHGMVSTCKKWNVLLFFMLFWKAASAAATLVLITSHHAFLHNCIILLQFLLLLYLVVFRTRKAEFTSLEFETFTRRDSEFYVVASHHFFRCCIFSCSRIFSFPMPHWLCEKRQIKNCFLIWLLRRFFNFDILFSSRDNNQSAGQKIKKHSVCRTFFVSFNFVLR